MACVRRRLLLAQSDVDVHAVELEGAFKFGDVWAQLVSSLLLREAAKEVLGESARTRMRYCPGRRCLTV